MARKKEESVLCQICKGEKKLNEVIPSELVRQPIVEIIKKTHPEWSPSGYICISDLNQFRGKYVQDVLETEKGEISVLEEQVMKSLKEHEISSVDFHKVISCARGGRIFPSVHYNGWDKYRGV